MSVVQVQAQLPIDELVRAVNQLGNADLDGLVQEVLALRARRQAPSVSFDEENLLRRINQGIPAEMQERYEALTAKRRAETLTPAEHAELLKLTDQIEELDAQRVTCLKELAQLRKITLTELLEQLGIHPTYE